LAEELARRLDVRLTNSLKKDKERVNQLFESVLEDGLTDSSDEVKEHTYLWMKFGKHSTQAKVGSGCKYNLISECLYLKLLSDGLCTSPLQPVYHIALEGPDQKDITLLGQVPITCEIVCTFDQRRRIKVVLEFLVIRNLGHGVLYGSQEICKRKTDVRLYDGVLIFENVSPFIPIGLIGVDQDPRLILKSVTRKHIVVMTSEAHIFAMSLKRKELHFVDLSYVRRDLSTGWTHLLVILTLFIM